MQLLAIDNYAIITALNFTTIILLAISAFIYFNLVYKTLEKETDARLKRLLEVSYLRASLGFMLVAIGFIIRIVVLLPLPFFGELENVDLIKTWEFNVKPVSQTLSSIFVFIGISFLMWPTIVKYSMQYIPENLNKKNYSIEFVFYCLFCLTIFLFGVILHNTILLLL